MKCAKPCWTDLESTGTGTVCPACGRTGPILTDPGYIKPMVYRISAYRPDDPALPSPFRPLPEELGWEQDDSEPVAMTPPRRTHPARLPATDPRNIAWRERLSSRVRVAAKDSDAIRNRREGALRRQRREARQRGAA